jgi:hypothetical protein
MKYGDLHVVYKNGDRIPVLKFSGRWSRDWRYVSITYKIDHNIEMIQYLKKYMETNMFNYNFNRYMIELYNNERIKKTVNFYIDVNDVSGVVFYCLKFLNYFFTDIYESSKDFFEVINSLKYTTLINSSSCIHANIEYMIENNYLESRQIFSNKEIRTSNELINMLRIMEKRVTVEIEEKMKLDMELKKNTMKCDEISKDNEELAKVYEMCESKITELSNKNKFLVSEIVAKNEKLKLLENDKDSMIRFYQEQIEDLENKNEEKMKKQREIIYSLQKLIEKMNEERKEIVENKRKEIVENERREIVENNSPKYQSQNDDMLETQIKNQVEQEAFEIMKRVLSSRQESQNKRQNV